MKDKVNHFKKRFLHGVALCGLAVVLLSTHSTPAYALLGISLPSLTDILTALAGVVNTAGQSIQSKINQTLNDISNTNNKQNVAVGAVLNNAASHTAPSGYSACAVQTGSTRRSAEAASAGQMSAALTQSQSNRPNDPSTQAQELKNKCALGLINTANATDPDSAAYKRLIGTCTPPSGMTAHPGADKSITSLLKPFEYFVPDNYPGQQTDGSYKILLAPTGGKDYSGFIAAYGFCQNVTPTQSAPPQGTGAATAGDMVEASRRNEQSKVSIISACWDALADRMQYASTNPVTAYDPLTNTMVVAHTLQYNECQDDYAANLLTSAQLSDCQQNGRSLLQAKHDRAYRLGAQSQYTTKVLSVVDRNTEPQLTAAAWADEIKFRADLREEQVEVQQAITGLKGTNIPTTSAADRPVQ